MSATELPPKQPYPRDALSVSTPPDADGENYFYHVGKPYHGATTQRPKQITRITVDADLTGLYCSLERVRVWVGDTMVAELPMHNVECVRYRLPEDGEAPA